LLNDEVTDRLHHGGFYKAIYLFGSDQYPFWKALYPDLDWSWGMFGENLTVSGFDERLEEGYVDIDDEFKLLELPENKITVAELFHLMYAKEKNQDLLKMASECNAIPHKKRMFFSKFIK